MSETAAAHLNFGPAWLRESLNSESPGSGLSAHPLNKSASTPSSSGYNPFPSTGLAAAKLADYRYGREEMLALFSHEHCSPPACQVSVMTAAGIYVEKTQYPVNLMGAMTDEEQRSWQRGANSESSLKLYKKDSGGAFHSTSNVRGVGSERGGRGGGRGVGGPRGGGSGGPYFDRQRSTVDEESLEGPIVGAGRGRGEDGRPFGRGSSRGFDRSVSDRGPGWFERSHGAVDDSNGGNISPRKGYTRAPFDDWRKPSGYQGDGEDENNPSWRAANTASGRRWNTPHFGERGGGNSVAGEGRGSGWRGHPSERDYPNGREEFSERGRKAYNSGSGSNFPSKYGRQRTRHGSSDNLPEWASDEAGPGDRGGSFDASGKFQTSERNRRPSSQDEERTSRNDSGSFGEGQENGNQNENWGRENYESPGRLKSDEPEVFEDEEVDVDDLPSDLRQDTLKQREREKESIIEREKVEVIIQEQRNEPLAKHDDNLPDLQLTNGEQQKLHDDSPHPQDVLWIYLDPQGNTQGPFSSSDMLEWFNAGYFPQDLMLRRTIDRKFIQLVDMTRRYGGIPFAQGLTAPGPILEQEQPIVTPQVPNDEEEKQRQQHILVQLQQQYVLHQHRVQEIQDIVINMQQNGTSDPSYLTVLTQELSERQKSCQIVMERLMQAITLSHHRHQSTTPPILQQSVSLQKEFPSSPGPSDFVSPMDGLAQRHHHIHQHHQPSTVFERQNIDPRMQAISDYPNYVTNQSPASNEDYDPIKSLLNQLQDSNEFTNSSQQNSTPSLFRNSTGSSPFGGFAGLQQSSRPDSSHQLTREEFEPRSVWGVRDDNISPQQKVPSNVWMNDRNSPRDIYQTTENIQRLHLQDQEETLQHHHLHQHQMLNDQMDRLQDEDLLVNGIVDGDGEIGDDFMKPRCNEKKDRKMKKAEEKRKQKEAKKAAQIAQAAQDNYIPGIPRPQDLASTPSEDLDLANWGIENHNRQIAQTEAYHRLQDEHRQKLELEALARQQAAQQQLPQPQVKLAPWAKASEENISRDLSLFEIQRLEEGRAREERLRRELEEQELRARQEAEAEMLRRQASRQLNWANAAASNGSGVVPHAKSLAEIQAEEERQERERQERERKEKKARQKEMGLAQASVWGGGVSNISWASRTAASGTPTQQPSSQPITNSQRSQKPFQQQQPQPQQPPQTQHGFWDDPPVQARSPQAKQQQPPQQQQAKTTNRNKKSAKEEATVTLIFREKQKPQNEFEAWCKSSLEVLNAEVDIPTFMAFLNDIETPYEVSDYIKNYVGEGKAHKNFAREYLERRSALKKSLKARKTFDDDLLAPAAAVNPNDPIHNDRIAAGGSKASSGNRSKKKGGKAKSKTDVSHLLSFSVAPTNRINAGELDLPN